MSLIVRQLTPADVDAYRALRLEALAEAPDAFGDALEEAEARPPASWRKLLEDQSERVFFGAFMADRMVGTVNIARERGIKLRHKCWLYGMYVVPDQRDQGIAEALVAKGIEQARAFAAIQVKLDVGAHNHGAKRLYERAGFIAYGTEPRALRVGDRFIDEILMVKILDED